MLKKTLEDLGWPTLLGHLADRCHTARGSATARALVPGVDREAARRTSTEIAEARLLWQLDAPMPFGELHDVREALGRVAKGGEMDAADILAIGQSVAACTRLRRHVVSRAAEAPALAARAEAIRELQHVSGPILELFDDTGHLADHASASLGGLRRKVAQLHEELARRVGTLLDDPGISPYLMDKFYTQRDDRYVVPLRVEARSRVPGIVHGSSQSGHTVFVEPQAVVDLNNKLKLAEGDVADEERRIIAELAGFIREETPDILVALDAAEALDVIDGGARLADACEASAVELAGEANGALQLRRARHPLMVLAGRECVANDIELAPGATLIISGPNAGGKTVALKTVGLAALMARAGLHVCADAGSVVPLYDPIDTDIGDDQSIERSLSTFSAHIHHLNECLAHARAGTLLLVDELCVGTDPDQGSALAQAVLETLATRGAQAVVTTHYERLKAMAVTDPQRFANASVGFDLEKMAPTFKLHAGVPGSSGAILVARRLGLDGGILRRTDELLGDRRAGIEELLTAVNEERRKLDAERAAAATAKREAEAARRDAEAAERAADALRERLRRGAHDDALAALRRARDELDELKERLKAKDKHGDDIVDAKKRLADVKARIDAHAPPAATPAGGRPAGERDLVAGTPVLVPKLGGRGQIVAAPERGRVAVQIGSLRTSVDVGEVLLDDRPQRKPAAPAAAAVKKRRASTEPVVSVVAANDDDLAPARTGDATCDLRGQRVDEALSEIDRFVDDSLLASREVIFVIHGHGTGALRSAVRDHLDMHAAVSKWRAGQEKEGGDGVTVVWLDV